MSYFGSIVNDATRAYCAAHHLPEPPPLKATPHTLRPFISNEDDEDALEALTNECRRDLLADMRSEELTKSIIYENDLQDGDLLARLLTIHALWDGRHGTALERMNLIDKIMYDTAQDIAERQARKELDL